MIKLIASDLDETLLPEGTFDLNPEYYDVIRQLSDKGILFAASSGRHYSSIAKLLGPVKDDIVILAGNGSCVMWKGKPLCLREIPYETYLRALKDMREVNPDIILTDHPDCVYTDTDNEEMFRWIHDGYRVNLHRCEDLSSVGTPVLKTAMFVSSDAAEYAGKLNSSYSGELNVMAAGTHWVDLVAKSVDKGAALGTVQERFGISMQETIAFGDNGNDIGMLKLAGHSYAVENARDEVKEAADEVIGPMREDAVLNILKALL